jgi:predicted nucleic acid-binding Zn ribbon protein
MTMDKRDAEDTPLKDLIDRFLKSYRLDKKMKEMEVINGWKEMMGVAIANRTEKLYIKNKVLHIKLNSSVMREELANGKQIILLRVNEFAGFNIINDIWFE